MASPSQVLERAEELGRLVVSQPGMEIAAGDAAVALLDKAREGDEARALIAVGSRGLGLAKRLRLGSVSTKVLRAARGPVLVYPRGGSISATRSTRRSARA